MLGGRSDSRPPGQDYHIPQDSNTQQHQDEIKLAAYEAEASWPVFFSYNYQHMIRLSDMFRWR